jgi:NADH dehydrogenase (ubiquinone) Fe-S protein 4
LFSAAIRRGPLFEARCLSTAAPKPPAAAAAAAAPAPAPAAPAAPAAPVKLTKEQQDAKNLVTLAKMEASRAERELICNNGIFTLVRDGEVDLPENKAEVATLDCTPKHITERTVVIRQPMKSAMSSSTARLGGWRIEWPAKERWTNPLTGWTSTADPMTSMRLEFDTKEQAIFFCEKKGIGYVVKERPPRLREYGKNYYAHNFLPPDVEAKLRVEGKATKHFDNPNDNKSHYFRPLTFHGEGPCRQHGPDQGAPTA